jgi:antitoxin MazE
MEARVSKWGNSLGLRIPLPIAKAIGLSENTTVQLTAKNGEIVVAKSKAYKLEDLLAKITTKNKHAETDTGSAVGKEDW